MRTFISLSLTIFFVLGFVGCGKTDKEKEEDKKADCEQDATKEWKNSQCVDKEKPVSPPPVVKASEDPEYYTVTNLLTESFTVSSGDLSVELTEASGEPLRAAADGSGCVKVKKSQLAEMKIVVPAGWWPRVTICNNDDDDNKCAEGHLEVRVKEKDGEKMVSDANVNCEQVLTDD